MTKRFPQKVVVCGHEYYYISYYLYNQYMQIPTYYIYLDINVYFKGLVSRESIKANHWMSKYVVKASIEIPFGRINKTQRAANDLLSKQWVNHPHRNAMAQDNVPLV